MAGDFWAPSKRVLRKPTFTGSIEVGAGDLHRAGGFHETLGERVVDAVPH